MYVRVANAIQAAGLSGRHPTDYLNFFCLAKREGPDDLAQMGKLQVGVPKPLDHKFLYGCLFALQGSRSRGRGVPLRRCGGSVLA